ncbi:MAG: response regulator [Chloroflexi bacterium]|nr:response regulator [Chloroflexota bacterium]
MSQLNALVVDDNKNNRDVLVRLLEREQVQCVQCQNASQISQALDSGAHFDVVFLDLEMPNLDGYTVLRAIRADPRFENAPVIAYTVHLSEISTVRDYGFDGFLGKPLDPDRFPDQFARIMNGESVWITN